MTITDIQELLDNNIFISIVSVIGGALLSGIFNSIKDKLRVLEYTVEHDRVGLSADDTVFGTVRVTWEGVDFTNLYRSVVTIVNSTTRDFVDLKLKVYTGDTKLLTERREMPGSTFIPSFTSEFAAAIATMPGQSATAAQLDQYQHEREYLVPVFNRGQKFILH